MNDYEWEFMQDSRDKKRTARGASARASRRRGLKGAVKTPVDYLKGKERKAYMSENTITSIISYVEFKALDLSQRGRVLARLLQKYTKAQLRLEWGVSSAVLSGIIYRLKKICPELVDVAAVTRYAAPAMVTTISSEPCCSVEGGVPAAKVIFSMALNGEFSGSDLPNRLLNISGLLDAGKMYHVTFTLEELEDTICLSENELM